jgi:thiamine kinase-like enzyme
LETKITQEKEKRETNGSDREKLMEKYKELKLQNESLKKEMKQFEKCDPARVDEIRSKTVICKQACDRWVDNIFEIESWMKKQNPGITSEDLAQ